jgi:hypothetical protein
MGIVTKTFLYSGWNRTPRSNHENSHRGFRTDDGLHECAQGARILAFAVRSQGSLYGPCPGVVMKNNIATTLIITAGVVALVIHFTPRPTPKTLASAPVVHGMSRLEIFNMNGKCGELANKLDEKEGVSGRALQGDHASHYNPRTNRCYLLESLWKNTNFDTSGGFIPLPDDYWCEALYDAQTGQLLLSAFRLEGPASGGGMDFSVESHRPIPFEEANEKINKLMHDEGEVKP